MKRRPGGRARVAAWGAGLVLVAASLVGLVGATPALADTSFSEGFEESPPPGWRTTGEGPGFAYLVLWDPCHTARTGCGLAFLQAERSHGSNWHSVYRTVQVKGLRQKCTVSVYAQAETWPSANFRLEVINPRTFNWIALVDQEVFASEWEQVTTTFLSWATQDVIIRATVLGNAQKEQAVLVDDVVLRCEKNELRPVWSRVGALGRQR